MIDEPGRMNDQIADYFDRVEAAWVENNIPQVFGKSNNDKALEEEEKEQAACVSVWVLLLSVVLAVWVGVGIGEFRALKRVRAQYNRVVEQDD